MEITDLKTDDKFLEMNIYDVSYEFVNELRRIIKTEVPVMAIEDVVFRENSSGLYDEIIAHRLGLIVLKTDLDTYVLPQECTCNGVGCSKCQAQFSLVAEGPKMVYAEDLKFKDPSIKPVYPKTPIVKLLDGQKLVVEGTACLGRGKDHMKWSPGHVHYFNLIKIKKVGDLTDEEKRIIVDKLSKYIDVENKKVKKDIIDDYSGFEFIQELKNVDYEILDNAFHFTFESWGQLPVKRVFEEAIKIINNKVADLQSWLKI